MSVTSSNPKPISPLRTRMIEDMTVRNFAAGTQREYIRAVKKLAGFIERSPDTATAEELRAFQLHLTKTGATPPTINATVTALRFFFKVTLDRPETTRHLVFVHEPRKLPRVLQAGEVLRLLEAAPNPKYKAALSVAYGAGLRAMEVVALKVAGIDSQRMLIRVEQGKGRKDRFAMLSPQLLDLLRDWYRIARPRMYLFPGQDKIGPMTTRQLNRICHMATQNGAFYIPGADHVKGNHQETALLGPAVVAIHHRRQFGDRAGARVAGKQQVQHRHEVALAGAERAVQVAGRALAFLGRALDEAQRFVERAAQLVGDDVVRSLSRRRARRTRLRRVSGRNRPDAPAPGW